MTLIEALLLLLGSMTLFLLITTAVFDTFTVVLSAIDVESVTKGASND